LTNFVTVPRQHQNDDKMARVTPHHPRLMPKTNDMLVFDNVNIEGCGEYAIGGACYGLASGWKYGGGFEWVI
jgi:hypothetical protein